MRSGKRKEAKNKEEGEVSGHFFGERQEHVDVEFFISGFVSLRDWVREEAHLITLSGAPQTLSCEYGEHAVSVRVSGLTVPQIFSGDATSGEETPRSNGMEGPRNGCSHSGWRVFRESLLLCLFACEFSSEFLVFSFNSWKVDPSCFTPKNQCVFISLRYVL